MKFYSFFGKIKQKGIGYVTKSFILSVLVHSEFVDLKVLASKEKAEELAYKFFETAFDEVKEQYGSEFPEQILQDLLSTKNFEGLQDFLFNWTDQDLVINETEVL